LLAFLENGIVGSWHSVTARHLSAFLDEMTFRSNSCSNAYVFDDAPMKLAEAPVFGSRTLIEAE
jgi:hypothetical protein